MFLCCDTGWCEYYVRFFFLITLVGVNTLLDVSLLLHWLVGIQCEIFLCSHTGLCEYNMRCVFVTILAVVNTV